MTHVVSCHLSCNNFYSGGEETNPIGCNADDSTVKDGERYCQKSLDYMLNAPHLTLSAGHSHLREAHVLDQPKQSEPSH